MSDDSIKINLKFINLVGEVEDAILTVHQDTVVIGSTTYNLLKKNTPADASGTTKTVSAASVEIVNWDKAVFQLTNCGRLLATTITSVYRAYVSSASAVINGQIDIKILQNDGTTIRDTVATGISASLATSATDWESLAGAAYSLSQYTVVDPTDWLELDFNCNVTTKKPGAFAYLRIDDSGSATADQTTSSGWLYGYIPANIKPILGELSTRKKGVSKAARKPLLGVLSLEIKGSGRKVTALLGLLSTEITLLGKNLKSLLGLFSDVVKVINVKRILRPLLGLSSIISKGFDKLMDVLEGLKSAFDYFKQAGGPTYTQTLEPLLGILSLKMKGISKKIVVLLGLLIKRIGLLSRSIQSLLGLLSNRDRWLNKVLQSLNGLLPLRTKGIAKSALKSLLGLLSLETKGLYRIYGTLLGILPSRSRLLSLAKSLQPLFGLLSVNIKGMEKFLAPLLGLLSVRRKGLLAKGLTTLLELLSRRLKSIGRKEFALLGFLPARLDTIGRILKPLFGLFSGIGVSLSKTRFSMLGILPIKNKSIGITTRLLLGLLSRTEKGFLRVFNALKGLKSFVDYIKQSGGPTYSETLQPLFGFLSLGVKSIDRRISNLLGLSSIRIKFVGRDVEVLLGLLSSKVKGTGKLFESLFGLSLGIIRSISKSSFNVLQGLLPSIKKGVFRQHIILFGFLSVEIKAVSKFVSSLLGLISLKVRNSGKTIGILLGLLSDVAYEKISSGITFVRTLTTSLGLFSFRAVLNILKVIISAVSLLSIKVKLVSKLFNLLLGLKSEVVGYGTEFTKVLELLLGLSSRNTKNISRKIIIPLGILVLKTVLLNKVLKPLFGLLSLISRYTTRPGIKKLSFVRSGYVNSFVRTIKKMIFKL